MRRKLIGLGIAGALFRCLPCSLSDTAIASPDAKRQDRKGRSVNPVLDVSIKSAGGRRRERRGRPLRDISPDRFLRPVEYAYA